MGFSISKTGRAFVVAIFVIAGLAVPATAAAGGPSLTLESSREQVFAGKKPATLTGNLSGVFSGNSGKTVTLHESRFPYETEQVASSTTTDANGDFTFPDISPPFNTRYRVSFDGDILDGDAQSEQVQIFVVPRSDYDIKVTRDGYAEARFDLFYPDELQPEYYVGRKDVHWYFGKTTQDRYKQVERTRFFDTDRGVASDVRFRLPRSRKAYRFFFFYCFDGPAEDIGIYRDEAIECPRSFKARSTRAAVPTATSRSAPVPSATRR